jgi:ADP-ribosylglycohydrolase
MKEFSLSNYYDKVLGSWEGRIAGDFMGAPVEHMNYETIREKYGEITHFPEKINLDYVNDDEMYEICALIALEKNGVNLKAKDIAKEWKDLLYDQNFTAEYIALQNLRSGILPPLSGLHNNVYFDAIGAQMRADIWGQITPGAPELAKAYAMMDGSISHTGVGIEGEIFVASMISNAFFENDITKIIEKSLEVLPKSAESLYAQMVMKAMEIYEDNSDNFRRGREKLMNYWENIRLNKIALEGVKGSKSESLLKRKRKRYLTITPGLHVLPNIGIIILSLLYGRRDEKDPFGRSICISAMMGLDTDCNCGNIGAILGAMLGSDIIPLKWREPLQDLFSTYVKGYEKWRITELARRVTEVGKRVIKEKYSGELKLIE